MKDNPERPDERDALLRRIQYCLLLLCGLLVLVLLYFASGLLLPIAAAVFLALIMMPLVRVLGRALTRPLASLLVLCLFLAGLAGVGGVLIEPAQKWISDAPRHVSKLEWQVRSWKQSFDEMKQTAERFENLASSDGKKVEKVTVESASLTETALSNSRTVIIGFVFCIVLTFLFLVYGERLIEDTVEYFALIGRPDQAGTFAVEVERALSSYLSAIALINAGLAAVLAGAMYLVGMPNPFFFGVLGGVLNFVPYLGPVLATAFVAIAAAVTFDTIGMMVLPPALYYLITAVEGTVVTPMVLGKKFTINPALVFCWLLLWSWLWGPVGALLAMPMLVTAKITASRMRAHEVRIFRLRESVRARTENAEGRQHDLSSAIVQ